MARSGNLSVELTSFVGRRRELVELRRLLAGARLVTLVGPGGVGKSRLALQAAARTRRPDGVWCVELSALSDPALLVETVERVLGCSGGLAAHVRDRDLLLVLDGCEHVLQECAPLAGALLAAAPRLHIVVTSREPLGLSGERLLAVAPFRVPEATASLVTAGEADSVRLLCERAGVVGFVLTEDNVAAVIRLCAELDGIPLAIELAAVRLRALTPEQIVTRLGDRWALLSGGVRVTPPWHQTLRTTIGWSHELCTPRERLLWARLSVFAGSFDLEAAESVCGPDLSDDRKQGEAGIDDVLGLMVRLVEKSIVMRDGFRFRLLQSIRSYGQDWLGELGETGELRRRHRDHYLRLALRGEAEWNGPAQASWCTRLRIERDNSRAALEYCLEEQGQGQEGLAMAAALGGYWVIVGAVAEGGYWLDRMLEHSTEATPLRAKAMWLAGWMAIARGDAVSAVGLLDASRELAQRLGYESALASAQQQAGILAVCRGDHESALVLLEEALVRHRAMGDRAGVSALMTQLALCHCLRAGPGDLDHAVALAGQCLEQSDWCRSTALYVQALAWWRMGRADLARDAGRDSLRLKAGLDDRLGIGLGLELFAWMAAREGRTRQAAVWLGAAELVWRETGAPLCGITQLTTDHDEAVLVAGMTLRLTPEQAVGRLLAEPAHAGSARPEPTLLTRREQQVADLIALGLASKEIADRLFLSRRTVDAHIGHILAKLGFGSRTQIAAWALERQRLGETPDEQP